MASRVDGWFLLLSALALISAGNAAWMLIDPAYWYSDLPAGVPDFGNYNEHFVRDIGCAFLTFALALAWAAFRPATRAPLVAISAVFFVAHALLHIYDTARGFVEADHWWLDLPGVYTPAVLLIAMTYRLSGDAPAPTDARL